MFVHDDIIDHVIEGTREYAGVRRGHNRRFIDVAVYLCSGRGDIFTSAADDSRR